MGWLDGKVALVTGGGSGIGRAVVQRYIEEGARVAVLEKVSDRLDQLKNDFGESVFPIQGDVTRLEDNQRAADDTARAFGKLDIFVGQRRSGGRLRVAGGHTQRPSQRRLR